LSSRFGRRQLVWTVLSVVGLLGVAGAVAVLARPKVIPDRLWVQAKDDFEAKRFDQAEAKLAQLAKVREPTGLDLMLRGEVAIAQNRIDDALAYLGRVPDETPMAAMAWLYHGQLELRRSRIRVAEEAFLHALKLDPKLERARRELVYIYGVQLRRADLRKQFAALSEQVRLKFWELFTWCLTLNVVWEPMESAADLERFVKADPTDRFSRLALAETLRQLQRLDEAEQVLSALPDTDPEARATRVRLALDRNDEKAAEALLADGPAEHG
jgi:tetratricopeptide (TPR) repeat protein